MRPMSSHPHFFSRPLSPSQSSPSISYWPERSLFSSGLLLPWTKYQQTTAGLEETSCQPRLEPLISSQRGRENQDKRSGASSKQPEREHCYSTPLTHIRGRYLGHKLNWIEKVSWMHVLSKGSGAIENKQIPGMAFRDIKYRERSGWDWSKSSLY